jgi:hypothetical protein
MLAAVIDLSAEPLARYPPPGLAQEVGDVPKEGGGSVPAGPLSFLRVYGIPLAQRAVGVAVR